MGSAVERSRSLPACCFFLRYYAGVPKQSSHRPQYTSHPSPRCSLHALCNHYTSSVSLQAKTTMFAINQAKIAWVLEKQLILASPGGVELISWGLIEGNGRCDGQLFKQTTALSFCADTNEADTCWKNVTLEQALTFLCLKFWVGTSKKVRPKTFHYLLDGTKNKLHTNKTFWLMQTAAKLHPSISLITSLSKFAKFPFIPH